ncbi:hypothetical protein FRC09_005236 [Ceratobasidium sp. 395]|nr:hypothetical protein FRC09_005236 [Ceratobasidium sp. 395]
MASRPAFDDAPILKYLSLDADYTPSPSENPIEFLRRHITQLPPHLLVLFSNHPSVTPRARASIPTIKNRRCYYAVEEPRALDPDVLSRTDADIWDLVNEERPQGQTTQRPTAPEPDEDVADERAWADEEFQGGVKGHVGKIGELLAELEGERTRERQRAIRRQAAVVRARREETEEEFDESSDEEDEDEQELPQRQLDAPEKDLRRVVRERFISGLLKVWPWNIGYLRTSIDPSQQEFDYDSVDWDEKWDPDDRDSEDRWFDEEEES